MGCSGGDWRCQTPLTPGACLSPPPSPTITDVQTEIEKHFSGWWSAVDAGLAVCARLLLEDNQNPVALTYVGPLGDGWSQMVPIWDPDETPNPLRRECRYL